jgi:hypothetical protein
MQEDSVTWNPTYFQPHIGPLMKVYVWLMLATLIVAFSKLIRLWIVAPPFRLRGSAILVTFGVYKPHGIAFSNGLGARSSLGALASRSKSTTPATERSR